MKRNYILPIIILAILIIISAVNLFSIKKTSENMIGLLNESVSLLKNGERENSSSKFDEFRAYGEKYFKFLHMSVGHDDLDDIKTMIVRSHGYLVEKEDDMFIAESEALLSMIEHIYETEKPCLENIL